MEGIEKQLMGRLPVDKESWSPSEAVPIKRVDDLRANFELSLTDGLAYFYSNYTHLDLSADGKREFTKEGAEVVSIILKQVGLPYERILKGWLAASYDERFRPLPGEDEEDIEFHDQSINFNSLNAVAYANLCSILELESEQEGVARYLHSQHGLANFARFPTALLLQQYKERDSQKPYGLYVLSSADTNGFLIKSGAIAESISKQLPPSHLQRIVEVGGKFDLVRRLLRFKFCYDKHSTNPVQFLVFAAHGREKSVLVGIKEEEKAGSVEAPIEIIDDINLMSEGFARAGKSILNPESDVILVACCTGARQGLAEVAAQGLNCRIIAPDKDIYMANIEVKVEDNGKIRLNPTYNGAEAVVYEPQ